MVVEKAPIETPTARDGLSNSSAIIIHTRAPVPVIEELLSNGLCSNSQSKNRKDGTFLPFHTN